MILLKTDESDPLIHVHKGFAKLAGDYWYIADGMFWDSLGLKPAEPEGPEALAQQTAPERAEFCTTVHMLTTDNLDIAGATEASTNSP